MSTQSLQVLIVVDDDEHAFLMNHAMRALDVASSTERVSDGEQAIDALGHGQRPDVVLLDLNLPRIGWLEVLEWIRDHESLRDLPVIITSTSIDHGDRERAAKLDVLAYCVKPISKQNLAEALSRVA